MVLQPSGTVTLVFTDVEGSTGLLERLGRERYAEALDLHRRLLREAFDVGGGFEVDCEGDAFFVAFASAEAAVAAAGAAQQALAAAHWPAGNELRVRMGVHTGEPLLVPPKYVGLDVHRAARIMAAGHGSQVVLSQTTRDLVGEAVAVRDLGEHRLKDLSAPQRLFQLLVESVRSEFPVLRSLENRPTNLPVQPTVLIGREKELRELEVLLGREEVRLVTLTGTGGTGKTRLALQAAAELVDDFAAGVFLVSLAAIRDPSLVVPTIAQTLGVREQAGEPLEQTLKAYVRGGRLLLVLDNFEQLAEAAPSVASLLAAAPDLKVMVTSRTPLRLSGRGPILCRRWGCRIWVGCRNCRGCASLTRSACLLRVRRRRGRTSWSPARTRRRWRRSVSALMVCRWRWSWQRHGCGCCRLGRCLLGLISG